LGSQLWDKPSGRSREGYANRHVDEENPSPRNEIGEYAAENQSDRSTARSDGAPNRQRFCTITPVAECRSDNRQDRRGEERATKSLECSSSYQHRRRLSQAIEEGRHCEDHNPEAKHTFATQDIAETTT
jgi:hypothetical protein